MAGPITLGLGGDGTINQVVMFGLGAGVGVSLPTGATLVIDHEMLTAAVSGCGSAYDTLGLAREICLWIIGNGNITAGSVRIEEAHSASYGGDWDTMGGAPVNVHPNAVIARRFRGCFRAIRVCVEEMIVGGTVTVILMGNTEASDSVGVPTIPFDESVFPDDVAIEMGLGGIFRHRIISEGDMVSVYPLSEKSKSVARDIVFDKNPGTWVGASGFGRAVTIDMPEGALGVFMDGNGYVLIPNDGDGYQRQDESGTRNLSLAGGDIDLLTLIQDPFTDTTLRAIAQKQEVNSSGNGWHIATQNGQIRFYLKVAGVVVFDFGRDLPDDTDLHLIQCNYDSITGAARIVIDGEQQGATVTTTPTDPQITTADMRIGMFNNGVAGDGSGFIGTLAYVSIGRSGNLALSGDLLPSLEWTDVSLDVPIGQMPITWRRGILGTGIEDNVARPGTMRFPLDNDGRTNTSGRTGYYSFGHANCRPNFKAGIPVRLRVTYAGNNKSYFRGFVKSADPLPGENGELYTTVTCVDWMHVAMRGFTSALPIQLDQPSEVLFGTVVDASERPPAALVAYAGSDQFPFAFDSAIGENDSPMSEFVRIFSSERGFVYPLGDGTLVGEGRALRQLVLDNAVTFTFQHGLEPTYDVDRIINVVRATFYPREQGDTNTEVVANFPTENGEHFIPPGGSVELDSAYRDPEQKVSRVGATEVQDPTPTTDYTMNSLSDGTGDDLTANFSVTWIDGGNLITWVITNNSSVGAYLTKLQARGRLLKYDEPQTVVERDRDSIREHGERPLALDLPYQSALSSAQGIARMILGLFSQQDRSVPVSASLLANYSDQVMRDVLSVDIGTRIGLEEPVSAIDDEDGRLGYFIQSEEGSIEPGPILRVQWGLSLPLPNGAYVLGEEGFSELGENTYLGL